MLKSKLFCLTPDLVHSLPSYYLATEGEGEVAVFSAKRWDRRDSYAIF